MPSVIWLSGLDSSRNLDQVQSSAGRRKRLSSALVRFSEEVNVTRAAFRATMGNVQHRFGLRVIRDVLSAKKEIAQNP